MKTLHAHAEEHAVKISTHGAKWLRSRYAIWILAAISFVESIFAPILIDPFLIALIFARREHWIRYVTISIVFSVLGGMVGYYLGLLFFDTVGIRVLELLGVTGTFNWIANQLDTSGFAFVLLGALTPIPYKLVAIASGFVEINVWTFFFASVFGRIIRLAFVGYAAYAVGPHALPIIRKHLLTLAYVFGAVLVAYLFVQFI